MADDDLTLSRRNLLRAGSATLTGAALGLTSAAAAPGGPAVPADTGAIQGGRV